MRAITHFVKRILRATIQRGTRQCRGAPEPDRPRNNCKCIRYEAQLQKSNNTRIRILRSYVLSVLPYGAEAWTFTDGSCKRIDAFEMQCYHTIFNCVLYKFLQCGSKNLNLHLEEYETNAQNALT